MLMKSQFAAARGSTMLRREFLKPVNKSGIAIFGSTINKLYMAPLTVSTILTGELARTSLRQTLRQISQM